MNGAPMNSRKVHPIIARVGKSWLDSAHFRPRGASGLWARTQGDGLELRLRFQCDKNGWDWSGSQLTLNFYLIDLQAESRSLHERRFAHLTEPSDGRGDVAAWWIEFLEPRMDIMLRRFLATGKA